MPIKKNSSELSRKQLQTREAILAAARRVMARTGDLSMDDVAREAAVSRTTIYRYFSNLKILLSEASILPHQQIHELNAEIADQPLQEQLLAVQHHFNVMAQENDTAFRRHLSVVLLESISTGRKLQGARRATAIQSLLEAQAEPLDDDIQARLTVVLSALMGIEAQIVCRDVCDLDPSTSREYLAWGLKMILAGVAATGGGK